MRKQARLLYNPGKLLPGPQGHGAAGLLQETLLHSQGLHRDDAVVLCVLVLAHFKYTLMLPLFPLARIALGEVAQFRSPRS